MTIVNTELREFEASVDRWVLQAVACGATTFERLLASLPSVYPSIVLEALQRLVSQQKLRREIWLDAIQPRDALISRADSSDGKLTLPVPHPLDYDWRFSDTAAKHLLNECERLTQPEDRVALLGTPSLLRVGIEHSFTRRLILLEANASTIDSFSAAGLKKQVVRCDLTKDALPHISAQAIVLDPPWYPEYIQSFLWAACQICEMDGYILISLPPIGTRPGIKREWQKTLNWTKRLGLNLIRLEPISLSYVTPPFERNALKLEGLSAVPQEWRRGDLAVFSRSARTQIPRPTVPLLEDEWMEAAIRGVRVRIRRPNLSTFVNPSLNSIIPGNVLQSVSRRDERRQLADVWTSGNRIFASKGRGVLWQILQALAVGKSPHQAVTLALQRSLRQQETKLVSYAANQIMDIIHAECQENSCIDKQWKYSQFSERAS